MQKRTCSSCGLDGHMRRSSKKCKLYRPIQGEVAPLSRDGKYKYEYAGSETVLKFSLNAVLKNSLLVEKITKEVREWSMRLHGASLAFRYYVLTTNSMPDLDEKFFYGLLALFAGCGFKCNVEVTRIVKAHFTSFIIPSKNQGQQIVYYSRTMKQNLDAHLVKCKSIAMARLARHALLTCIGVEDTSSRIGAIIKQMFGMLEGVETDLAADTEFDEFGDLLERFENWYLLEDTWDILHFLKYALDILAAGDRKRFHITPLFSLAPKHITVDTKILRYLARSKTEEELFLREKLDSWKALFNIPSKYFPDDYEHPLPGTKYFTGMLLTDGVSCSLVMKSWYRCLVDKSEKGKPPPTEETLGNQFQKYCTSLPRTNLIGVDPGRKDIFTYVCSNGNRGSLSNAQYYHEAHFKKHLRIKKQMFADVEFPSLKSTSAKDVLQYVGFLSPHLPQLTQTYQSKKWKKMRLDAYIMKKKCLDGAIKQMVSRSGSRYPVVGFGNASFNHASKGHSSSPRRLWAVERMKKVWKLHVISINEFNTSQICNKCKSLSGLSGISSISKPHFVRQCANTECRAIWNRDINASLNMKFLLSLLLSGEDRPDIFRVPLKKLRLRHASGNQPTYVHD